ncbi:PH domain-containing protein [Jatrophihabitans sp. GAS493]|uniref:PH domain-containing protein n=1 Tax=Jatrophihabitans sp. GAS493 TaxID=1907575 RepID=UPI000BB87B46|nr:PH domain-containing protein [Jatrophihabitans sp. GAS493]
MSVPESKPPSEPSQLGQPSEPTEPSQPTRATRFALSRSAYLAVALLAGCLTVLVRSPALLAIYLIPIAGAFYVARTATIVASDGIAVRALFGTRIMRWEEIRGLSVTGRSVYAVLADGSVRLPCVRLSDLAALTRASAGHLPQMAEATPKYAPQAHRRR